MAGRIGNLGKSMMKALCVLVVLSMALPGYLPYIPVLRASAQTDPPPFGDGDWVINDATVIKDKSLAIRGAILINAGGSLTLENTTLIIMSPSDYACNITAWNGSSISILDHSFVGSGDALSALQVAPLARLVIQNSTISGFGAVPVASIDALIEDSEFIGNMDGFVQLNHSATIRRSKFSGTLGVGGGIWASKGHLDISDSVISDNSKGIEALPLCNDMGLMDWPKWTPYFQDYHDLSPCQRTRDIHVNRSLITRNAGSGVYLQYSDFYMYHSQITYTSQTGIFGYMPGYIDVEDSEISQQQLGIQLQANDLMGGGPHGILKNVNITDSYDMAYYGQDSASTYLNWYTDGEMRVEDKVQGNIQIAAKAGGHVVIDSATFEAPGSMSEGITAESGGTVDILNSTIGNVGQIIGINAQAGGAMNVRNSTIVSLGTAIYASGDLTLDNSTVTNSATGVLMDGGRTEVVGSLIYNCGYGLQVKGGAAKVYETDIVASKTKDIYLGDATVDVYDTNFTTVLPATTTGALQTFWSSSVESMWENGATIGNVSINVSEEDGTPVWSGMSGPDGLTATTYLRSSIIDSTGTRMTTPHHVTAKFKGMSNSTSGLVQARTVLPVYLEDHIMPLINITSPGRDVFQTNQTLVVNGTASDAESGLDFVQWSMDEDLWLDADGLDHWGFTTTLKYGTYQMYVRAVDRAGNGVILVMNVTIDDKAPFIYILSPHNGFVTKLTTVLVSGATERGAIVTIGSQSVVAPDGTFRLSVPIAEGNNTLLAMTRDATGNSNSTSVWVIRDTRAPLIDLTFPPDGYITNDKNMKNLPVTGRTEPGARLMFQGRPISVEDDGNFSFTTGLVEGVNEIALVAEDELGNQNATVRKVIYDITPPTLKLTAPEDGLTTNALSVMVEGVSEPFANISAKTVNNSAKAQVTASGLFQVRLNLSEGQNVISVQAKDRAGNSAPSKTVTVVRDTIKPFITFFDVKDGMSTDKSVIILEAQTEANARMKFQGNIVQVGREGRFSVTLDLVSANNTFKFEALDKAGNSNTTYLHIMRKMPPGPKTPGQNLGNALMPWLMLIAIILVLVQWAVVAQRSNRQAKARSTEGDAGTKEGTRAEEPRAEGPTDRVRPRRPKGSTPVVVDTSPPEFDIEYGEGDGLSGGGRQ